MAYKRMILDRLIMRGFNTQKTGKCYFWFLQLDTMTLLEIEMTFLKITIDK